MQKAHISLTDKRLKILSLLHTDGVKTIEIAKRIKKELKNIGMDINLAQVSYKEHDIWVNSLASGKFDFYLMGYKADTHQLFATDEAVNNKPEIYLLLAPLFSSSGEANFTGYRNIKVDNLLSQVEQTNPLLNEEREPKLKTANKIIYKDLPVIVLFYIEKL
jgi:ABC-type transport system substrate-binding protein